jgi:hypothetical protein
MHQGIEAMAEISELREELAVADRHIKDGEGRIARQSKVVRQLAYDGHDTLDAENLLQAMNDALAAMETHRRQIVRELSCASDEQRGARR